MPQAIFDLDGTISDPAEGITKSINHALVELGEDARPVTELLPFIGPPLEYTFQTLLADSTPETIGRAINLYRERYGRIGYSENKLYPGIVSALNTLRAQGYTLHIATTKRTKMARRVLSFFDIEPLFTSIHGCDGDLCKINLLRKIVTDLKKAVMIGDRDSDFRAAREAGIPSIGVAWGFGPRTELEMADLVVDRPEDLVDAIERSCTTQFRA